MASAARALPHSIRQVSQIHTSGILVVLRVHSFQTKRTPVQPHMAHLHWMYPPIIRHHLGLAADDISNSIRSPRVGAANIWCSCSNRAYDSIGFSRPDIASLSSPPGITTFGTDPCCRRRFHRTTSTYDTMSLHSVQLRRPLLPSHGFSMISDRQNQPIIVSKILAII